MSEVEFSAKWWVVEALLDTEKKVLCVTGGLGGGKTDGLVTLHHDRVVKNKLSKFSMFFEPTHRLVETGAVPKYEKHLQRLGFIRGVHYKVTKSPHYKITYLLGIGHEVHFHSFERPELIVSVDVSHVTIDEAGDSEKEAYTNARRRIRCPNATVLQMLIGGAPQGVNWFADEFDSEVHEGWDLSVDRDHVNHYKGYRRFIIWTDENMDNLPSDYIENLMIDYSHNPGLVNSYRFGKFCPLTLNAAYSNYRQYNDIDDIEPSPDRDVNLTFDFNAQPVSWVSIQRIPFTEGGRRIFRQVCIHESNDEANQLSDACIDFAVKHPPHIFGDTLIRIFGDRTGHAKSHKIDGSDFDNIKKYLKELGFRKIEICAAKAVAPEAESVDAVQKMLMNNLLVICKRLKGLRRSWLATEWQVGVRKLLKPAKETHTHKGDAVKYYIYQECRDETGNYRRKIFGTNK